MAAATPKPKVLSDNFYEFCRPENYTVEVIFFHGLQLGDENPRDLYLSTWRTKGSEDQYWPQTFFQKDEFLKDENVKVRALAVRYDASKVKTDKDGRLDEYLIAETFTNTIISRRFKVGLTKGVPVILVGHSFGGLMIKAFLNSAATAARRNNNELLHTFLDNVAGVFFYSTPHSALRDEVVQALFPRDGQYSDLIRLLQQLNKDVARLQQEFERSLRSRQFGKNWGLTEQRAVFESEMTELAGLKSLMIVEEGSGRGNVDTADLIKEDHFDICRPANTESLSFQRLADFIHKQQTRGSASPSS
ncbi:hypothetical protein R1sor_014315 [Riccia sorocarpa]|uniref:AB hydrolase-1 domain-containing protein n=1 Tax=Riccia sorocarpa TaxID=122646 RepID=A0ABD3HAZ7_9MARC